VIALERGLAACGANPILGQRVELASRHARLHVFAQLGQHLRHQLIGGFHALELRR
jgi:hypothetical protein